MGNRTKVMQLKNKQLLTTIPKALGEALKFKKGDTLEWNIELGQLVIKKVSV